MLKMVAFVSSHSLGSECENVAVLEFVQEKLSNSSTFIKCAVTRGYEYLEITELSQTAFKLLKKNWNRNFNFLFEGPEITQS